MPTAMTYASLKDTDLPRYLERGFVTDTEVYEQLPNLINQAERDAATKLKILGFLLPVTDTLVAGTGIYAKPDRWRGTASINFGIGTPPDQERRFLFPRSYEYCRMYWPNSALRDVPEFYADYDYQHIIIVPTPIAAYPYEWNYWQQLPLLDDSNQTNWLTDYAPQLLLYGTLVECEPYLKDGPWTEQWRNFYNDQITAVNAQDLQRVIDRTTIRSTV